LRFAPYLRPYCALITPLLRLICALFAPYYALFAPYSRTIRAPFAPLFALLRFAPYSRTIRAPFAPLFARYCAWITQSPAETAFVYFFVLCLLDYDYLN
jgi:hypothetical protein